jgi:NADH:ubiquinone reductase (H+-translocating)
MERSPSSGPRKRVVVVGAGFGGLTAAKKLRKQNLEVVLIDQHNYHTFQPLLYQVATAGLNSSDVAYPVRGLFRRRANVLFKQGVVSGIDWDDQRVLLRDEDPIGFDYLVLSAGSTTAYFGVPGAQEYALPLYSLPDALRVRNHLLSLFEAADARTALVEDGVLNFVVVGGGATGVEVSGAVAELIERVLADDYHDLDVHRARVILLEQSDALLTPFVPKLREYTRTALEKRGVEVRLNSTVERIAADHVELAGGEQIPTRMVLWAAGVRAGDIAAEGSWGQGRGGRITVGRDLSVPGHPDMFAIGDIADIDDGEGGRLPQLAQVAIQGGRFVAKQIRRSEAGEPRQEFSYLDKGTMATIGRRAAVAELAGGARLTGLIAWLAWLFLHLVYLLGARNKVSTMANWFWNYCTWASGPRLILNPENLPQSPRSPPDEFTPRGGDRPGRQGG